jgi:hypothetical protein
MSEEPARTEGASPARAGEAAHGSGPEKHLHIVNYDRQSESRHPGFAAIRQKRATVQSFLLTG